MQNTIRYPVEFDEEAKVTVEEEVIDETPGTAIYIPAAAKHKIVNAPPSANQTFCHGRECFGVFPKELS